MAKDPAVLFYTSDFLSGTSFFNHDQKGRYITLLCEQHQLGSIPEEHLIDVCGGLNTDVAKKFIKDSDGTYYNVRMREESDKRRAFCESRRKSIEKRYIRNTYVDHTKVRMENENENENTNAIKDEKFLEFWKVYPKKVGKGDAEKAWNKIKEPSKILELIIKALEWQTKSDQWKKENGQYIPNPSTYLNRRHWEDEKGEVLNGTGKSGLSGNCRENNFRNNEPALGARAKPGEYDEGIITLEGVPDHR